MVLWLMSLSCIVITPPALRLWLPTCFLRIPCFSRLRDITAFLTAVFIVGAVIHLPPRQDYMKYVPMMTSASLVWLSMYLRRHMSLLIGQCCVWIASWGMVYDMCVCLPIGEKKIPQVPCL